MSDPHLDSLSGAVTALTMIVSQLVRAQASAQSDPPEWLAKMQALCLAGLGKVDREVGGDVSADATLDAATDLLVQMFNPKQAL